MKTWRVWPDCIFSSYPPPFVHACAFMEYGLVHETRLLPSPSSGCSSDSDSSQFTCYPQTSYILCTVPHFLSAQLAAFDGALKCILSQVLNIDLSQDLTWLQASLPLHAGGLGVRKLTQFAPSIFLPLNNMARKCYRRKFTPHTPPLTTEHPKMAAAFPL